MTLSSPAADIQSGVIRKFVRITGQRSNAFIEFDFAIGDSEIFVELILPMAAFEEFCSSNKVVLLEDERPDCEQSDWSWRIAQAQQQRFR
jgi:phenol hydroxylase P0 protein